jgi:hypothetical protein
MSPAALMGEGTRPEAAWDKGPGSLSEAPSRPQWGPEPSRAAEAQVFAHLGGLGAPPPPPPLLP